MIPCRNEAAFIGKCLDSVLSTTFSLERLEVLVVDGMSEDGTRNVVRDFAGSHPAIKLIDNPAKITPCALNAGIRHARGEIIIRMDAHTTYPPNYIGDLVDWLSRSGADNVGGVWITLPAKQTSKCRAIAAALTSPFGVGNAHYRVGVKEPRWVDTVPFGCYQRQVFDRIGLFDEELVRNQDDEFNGRLVKSGGRILLVPSVVSYYTARDSLIKLWRTYYQYGLFKPLAASKAGRVTTWRQLAPVTFVVALLSSGIMSAFLPYVRPAFIAVAGGYLLADAAASVKAARTQRLPCVSWTCMVFPVLHLSYGFGYLVGILRLARRQNARFVGDQVPLTR